MFPQCCYKVAESNLTFYSMTYLSKVKKQWVTLLLYISIVTLITYANRLFPLAYRKRNIYVTNKSAASIQVDTLTVPELHYQSHLSPHSKFNETVFLSKFKDKCKPLIPTAVPTKRRIILYWTKFFGRLVFSDSAKKDLYFYEYNRTVGNCLLTFNRSLFDVADAVVFHIRDFNKNDLPPRRHAFQRYVFYLLESPPHTAYDLKQCHNFFNWTMTYRRDSDIYADEYGQVRDQQYDPNKDYMANKSKMAVWTASNCSPTSKRQLLVKLLREKYNVSIDVFGDCANPSCPCKDDYMECINRRVRCGKPECPWSDNDLCMRRHVRDYKFALAFENSICEDYLSEKFFNWVDKDIIVVTLNGANYSKYMRKGAVLDTKDFGSVAELASRLHLLANNRDLYNAHFKWRDGFKGYFNDKAHYLCELCVKLNDPTQPAKVYEDMHGWWMKDRCHDAYLTWK